MLLSTTKKILLSCLLAIATNTVFIPCTIEGKESAQRTDDFTGVAKKAIPGVVSISVRGTTKKTISSPWGLKDDESLDFFGEDFLQRFFGFQKRDEVQQSPISGQASGFLISKDGKILTNSHVVKDADEITVVLYDGREFKGKVVGQDQNTDIAVIQIEADNLPFLSLGNSDDLEVGQWVVAIGNPLGLQASLTVGVVSATGRNNLDLANIEDFIQTDAAINRGNSGGPLLGLNGEVVGMNTAIVTNMATGGYMGIGFAIPSNLLKHVTDELMASGSISRGFLGVSLQKVDSNLAQAFHLEKIQGALIADVSKNSPAEAAGLKQGDIILKYNQQSVNNIATLRNAISLMKPGTSTVLTLMREGKTLEIPVQIGTFPQKETEIAMTQNKTNKFGFTVEELTPELSKSLGIQEEKGVIISKVEAGSPASWAHLKKGTVILAINQKKIESLKQFDEEMESLEKNKSLLLLVRQDGAVRFVSLLVNS